MERLELTFSYEKETKNTIRYQEESGQEAYSIGYLYIQKGALGQPIPKRLKVAIESLE